MSQSIPFHHLSCPDCSTAAPGASRRDFIKTAVGGIAGVAASGSLLSVMRNAAAAAAPLVPPITSETLVAQLYKSLNDQQKKTICFGFQDPLRSKVDNNWHIIKPTIKTVFNPDQRDLVRQIFMSMHSEEYAKKVYDQVDHDNHEANAGGFEGCSVALFGEPGKQFEFVFTGRHVTRRCDGNSVDGEAFGGPIFYGHAALSDNEAADHPGNAYWYQAKRANELYQALDGKQRKLALNDNPRSEKGTDTVALTGTERGLTGIRMSDLSRDQQDLAWKVMHDVLAPFRKTDADKAMKLVEDAGREKLHFTFYNYQDIGNDGVWDIWQIEGPSMVWYFRGAPHVHTWVHVRDPKAM